MSKRKAKSKALAVRKPPAESGVKTAVAQFIANIQGNMEIREAVMAQLKPSVHYGSKGSNKPYLYQAGATIIAVGFNVRQGKTEVKVQEITVEEATCPVGKAWIIEARTDLVSRATGEIVWEGRWRSASSLEPKYYERDTGACRVADEKDFLKLREEVMTTATKRAFTDAVRMFAGIDDKFTQDEELVSDARSGGRPKFWRKRKPKGGLPQPAGEPATAGEGDPGSRPTGRQLSMLAKAGVNIDEERQKRGWMDHALTIAEVNQLMRECVGKKNPQPEEEQDAV